MGKLRNIYLVISQGCNLSCGYCYAKGGDFGRGGLLMDSLTMRKALDRLLPLSDGSCTVSFFGGEPLLNRGLMRETVAYGRELKEKGYSLSYSITTNGTLLDDETVSFLKEEISHIAVSLDGKEQVNDSQRRFRNGAPGVHDAVTEGLRRLRKRDVPFGIRATVTEEAAPLLTDNALYLNSLGPVSLRLSPATGMEWDPAGLSLLAEEYAELYRSSLEGIYRGEEPVVAEHLYKVLLHLAAGEKRLRPCLAGEGIIAVAADGEVFPCDHFIGAEGFGMGSVHDPDFPGEAFFRVRERVMGNTVEKRRKCSSCGISGICGGECHAASLMAEGEIETPSQQHCGLTRGITERLIKEVRRDLEDDKKRARIAGLLGV